MTVYGFVSQGCGWRGWEREVSNEDCGEIVRRAWIYADSRGPGIAEWCRAALDVLAPAGVRITNVRF